MSIIEDIDHISTVVDDAGSAIKHYHETLGLELAWDLTDYGPFTSGAVRMGNLDVEVLSVKEAGQADDWPKHFLTLQPIGVVGLTQELESRGLQHGAEQPFTEPGGEGQHLFTMVRLFGSFAGPTCPVQLCRFAFLRARPEQPEPTNPVGFVEVDRLRIGANNVTATIDIWQRLLVPTFFDGNTWMFERGPGLSVEPAPTDSLIGLVARVESLDDAADALNGLGVDGDRSSLETEGFDIEGLRFFLTE